ncbi:MAG: hypothetical protein V1839_01935 [archaeon]
MAEQGRIDISRECIEKIQRYVKDGRFSDMNDFINQAVKLLLMAEDNREEFSQIIKKE